MRRRPWGIWVVVALQVALAMTLLPWVAESFPGASPLAGITLSDMWHEIYIVWAILNVLAAIWLWTLSRRGWVLVMVLVGIGLVANLYLWSIGQPAWLRMAIQAATAFYLNSSPVRNLFERRTRFDSIVMRDTDAEAAS
jgi:hypothetical protein